MGANYTAETLQRGPCIVKGARTPDQGQLAAPAPAPGMPRLG